MGIAMSRGEGDQGAVVGSRVDPGGVEPGRRRQCRRGGAGWEAVEWIRRTQFGDLGISARVLLIDEINAVGRGGKEIRDLVQTGYIGNTIDTYRAGDRWGAKTSGGLAPRSSFAILLSRYPIKYVRKKTFEIDDHETHTKVRIT
jgi:hypothetical protein